MTVRPSRAAATLSTALLTLPMATAVRADDATIPETAPQVLQPITVQARQWTEDVQDVPGSVDVLTWERLETPLWDTLETIPKISPNVQIEDSSVQSRVVIRGITSANTALQDPVGYFVNDVALPMGISQAPKLFNVEQMEILKGPQGSLFGRNTEAGAIRVDTTDPTWEPTYWASLNPSLRNGDDRWEPVYVGSAGVSGTLVEGRLAGSLAVRGETTDGIRRNLYDGDEESGDTDRLTMSGGLQARLGDDTDVSLKSIFEYADEGKSRMRYVNGPYATDAYTTNYNTETWNKTTTAIQSLRIDHRFNDVDLTSVTGWTHYHRDMRMDIDLSPMPSPATGMDTEDDMLSQELRLTSNDAESRLRWLTGLYAYRQWTDVQVHMGTPLVYRDTDIDQVGLAGFGQVEVSFTDKLRLGIGGRVEWINQSGEMTLTSTAGRSTFDRDLDTVTLLPRFTLAYDVTPDVMVYGSYARGYLPGGYNVSMATDAESLAYDPEYTWTAEAGVKATLFGGRARTGLALFHTSITDKQILDLQPGGIRRYSNAAEAEIYGFEASADAQVTSRWSVFGTLGLQHAEATDYVTDVSGPSGTVQADLSGNALPMAADVTYSVGARYDEGSGWFGEASLNGSGPYYFDSRNTLEQDAFVRVDAEIGYRFEAFEVALWSANLTGENVYTRAVSNRMGAIFEDGAPREVGLRVKVTW